MFDFLRLILVEDNPYDADLIIELLTSCDATPVQVTCAARLSQALQMMDEQRFDMVLLDLGLPDSDGRGRQLQTGLGGVIGRCQRVPEDRGG